MKKILAAILSLSLIFSMFTIGAVATSIDEKYENEECFTIDEDTSLLTPGQDYYFKAYWGNSPMDDEFFEFYNVSISVGAPEGSELSTSSTKKYVSVAKLEKASDGHYYFHFRATNTQSYLEDIPVRVRVMAKDNGPVRYFINEGKNKVIYASWYDMELDVGYSINSQVNDIYEDEYTVDPDSPVVEFDSDLKDCRIEFDDTSFYQAKFSKVRKFNLGHTFVENAQITSANPGASLKFINFYAKPKFASASVLKIYAPGKQFLYEISADNKLTLLSSEINGDYFGISTAQLGSYVASNKLLTGASVGTTPPAASSSQASSGQAAQQPPTTAPVNPPTGAAL